jgi:uncharacterized protein YqgC (DUF456 family)
MKFDRHKIETTLVEILRRANYFGSRRLGPGVRTVTGILFIVGGIFGFLPVLGFWMIPLGIFLIVLEIPAWRKPLRAWLNGHKKRVNGRGGANASGARNRKP